MQGIWNGPRDYEREGSSEKVEGAISKGKQKLRNDWKKESEDQKVSFREMDKQQIRDGTKQAVIQFIKEKKI